MATSFRDTPAGIWKIYRIGGFPMSKQRFLTPPQVAERFGVHPDKVRGWIRRGELLALNLGDKRRPRFRIRPEDLEIFDGQTVDGLAFGVGHVDLDVDDVDGDLLQVAARRLTRGRLLGQGGRGRQHEATNQRRAHSPGSWPNPHYEMVPSTAGSR